MDEGVPIGAIACDCGDASAIYLRHCVRQAIGHYAIRRVSKFFFFGS